MRILRRRWGRTRGQRGFTLIELMVVVAIIAILAATAIALYNQIQSRARIAKAQADLMAIASAVTLYSIHVGSLPPSLSNLTTTAANAQGLVAGPFLASIPSPPGDGSPAWTAYDAGYVKLADGLFSISASGDGTTVVLP